jgi:hypothetical protein
VACVRARLAPLGGERGHSKSGLHPWYPLKGVPIFIFLPHDFLAVTVTRHAEKHFALLFSAGNSYTVYIRPSKIPGNSRIFFAALFGSRHHRCCGSKLKSPVGVVQKGNSFMVQEDKGAFLSRACWVV